MIYDRRNNIDLKIRSNIKSDWSQSSYSSCARKMEKILNKEDCEEIIKNYLKVDGNVVVHRFQILPLSDEYPGFCADYCRLKIMFNDVSYYMRILKGICIEKIC